MFNDGEGWKCTKNFIFISPVDFIQDKQLHRADKDEEEHVGIVKYSNYFKKRNTGYLLKTQSTSLRLTEKNYIE